jgi:hypothetical protein
MKIWSAIFLTIGIIAVFSVFSCFFPNIGSGLMEIIIFGTALWAAIDSKKIQLKRYKSGISYGPIVLFVGFVLLWIVAFPWYLSMRYKIKNGTAVLKAEVVNVAA